MLKKAVVKKILTGVCKNVKIQGYRYEVRVYYDEVGLWPYGNGIYASSKESKESDGYLKGGAVYKLAVDAAHQIFDAASEEIAKYRQMVEGL